MDREAQAILDRIAKALEALGKGGSTLTGAPSITTQLMATDTRSKKQTGFPYDSDKRGIPIHLENADELAPNQAGNYIWTGTQTFNGPLYTTGIITPTALAANTNDYAPTSFSTCNAMRLSSSAAYNITGLAGGTSGRLVQVCNVGSYVLTLTSEDASSSAANRFALTGPVSLAPNDMAWLWYDATSSRWRLAGLACKLAAIATSDQTVDSTTLTADNALLVNVQAGRSYVFEAHLLFTPSSTAADEWKLDFNQGSATATTFAGEALAVEEGVTWLDVSTNRPTALADTIQGGGGAPNDPFTVIIRGILVVNAGGTFGIKFAKQADVGSGVVRKAGSYLRLTPL